MPPNDLTPANVARRWSVLHDRARRDQLLQAARSAVARWVLVPSQGGVAHDLRPYRQQTLGLSSQAWRSSPERDGARLGLDHSDRPVLYEVPGKRWDAITRSDGVVELVSTQSETLRALQVMHVRRGRPYELAIREAVPNEGLFEEWSRFVYDDDVLKYFVTRRHDGSHDALRFTLDEQGELTRVEQIIDLGEFPAGAFDATVAQIVELCDHERAGTRRQLWQRPPAKTQSAPAPDLPALSNALAQRLTQAVHAAHDVISSPVCLLVLVSPHPAGKPPSLLQAAVMGASYLERKRDEITEPVEALFGAFEGADDTVTLSEADLYAGALQQTVQRGLQALAGQRRKAEQVGQELSLSLARALLTVQWPGDDTFFPIVIGGSDLYGYQLTGWPTNAPPPMDVMRAAAGDDLVNEFVALIMPRRFGT